MAKQKLQKKARAIKTVESYATPDCSTCANICNMTVADVRAETQTYLKNLPSGLK
ncbi:MAG: hypothetical protein HDT15_01025 [Oscillibacter sp.]|nr:hypothetical protein [Oscillibacter sp.]MBD5170278.1 hypothetical protein [Oscillibacter sp.]